MHVTDSISNYDMIVRRDLLQELGIVLHFGDLTLAWDHAIAPMKNHDSLEHNVIVAIDSESSAIVDATDWMKQNLEAEYEAANIKNVVAPQNKNICLLFSPDLNHCLMEHSDIGKRKHMTSH
jgi:hypothetical protein